MTSKNNKINIKANVCMVLGIINMVIILLLPVDYINVCSYISILLGVMAIVFYILVKRELDTLKDGDETKGKKQAKIGFILSIICISLSFINLLSLVILNDPEITSQIYCIDKEMVNKCATSSDDVTSCKYMNTLDIQCYTDVLEEEQYK